MHGAQEVAVDLQVSAYVEKLLLLLVRALGEALFLLLLLFLEHQVRVILWQQVGCLIQVPQFQVQIAGAARVVAQLNGALEGLIRGGGSVVLAFQGHLRRAVDFQSLDGRALGLPFAGRLAHCAQDLAVAQLAVQLLHARFERALDLGHLFRARNELRSSAEGAKVQFLLRAAVGLALQAGNWVGECVARLLLMLLLLRSGQALEGLTALSVRVRVIVLICRRLGLGQLHGAEIGLLRVDGEKPEFVERLLGVLALERIELSQVELVEVFVGDFLRRSECEVWQNLVFSVLCVVADAGRGRLVLAQHHDFYLPAVKLFAEGGG